MRFYRAGNGISAPMVFRFGPPIAAAVLAVVVASLGVGQQTLGTQQSREKLIQEAYAKHGVKIRHLLPPYSGPPSLLDLYQRRLEDGMCNPEQHVRWESNFNGIMSGHAIVVDHGFSKPAYATATTFVTTDTFAPIYSLPAKRSFTVVLAKPTAGKVCISQSRRYVYTKFTLKVFKEFQKGKSRRKQAQRKSGQITAVDFGGTVRFPSGYLETFLLNHEGFLEVGEKYVLFMWKPVPSDDTLVISQAYLIRDGFVFPVDADGDAQTVYTKMPLPEFEAKVEAAVRRNIDTDVLPNVHAAPRRRK
ncbi:MAG: hypothetical protein ACRD22_17105 [Terriglobia bacterium]